MHQLFKIKSYWHHIIIALFVVPLIFLRNYAYYWDGVDYAWQVEHAPFNYTFHQHHLIYTPLMKLLYLVLTCLGFSLRALDFMIAVNVIVGICFITICFIFLDRFFLKDAFLTVIGTLIIALSYTFVNYWRNVDAYIIPLTLLMLVFFRISHIKKNSLHSDYKNWILLFFATIIHQMSILSLPALAYAQLRASSKRGLANTIFGIICFSIALLIVYLLIFYLMSPHITHKSFIKWVTGYAAENYWIFRKYQGLQNIIYQSIREGVLGHKNLFLPPIRTWLILSEDRVIYSNFKYFVFLSWLLFFWIYAAIVFGAIKLFKSKEYKDIVKFMFIWIAPFIVLFQVFTPISSFYRLFYILPMVVFLMVTVKHFAKLKYDKVGVLIVLTCYLAINVIFGYIHESNKSSNSNLIYAEDVQELTSPRDLFIFSPSPDYQPKIYLSYFTDRDVFTIRVFPKSKRKNYSDKELISLCNESKKWLEHNYDRFYFSRGVVNYPIDILEISTLDQKRNLPNPLVIHKRQIEFTEIIEIGSYPFNHGKINELSVDDLLTSPGAPTLVGFLVNKMMPNKVSVPD